MSESSIITVVDTSGNATTYDLVDASAVHFTEQALTNEQQAQARANIGAVTVDEVVAALERPGQTNLIEGLDWRVGYIRQTDGNAYASDLVACYNQEVNTGHFAVTSGDSLTIVYSVPIDRSAYTASGNYTWFRVAYFNEDKVLVSESTFKGLVGEANGDREVVSQSLTVPDGCSTLRISGRTYYLGEEWAYGTVSSSNQAEYDSIVDEYGKATFALYDNNESSATKLLPDVAGSDDGLIMSTLNGSWVVQNPPTVYNNPTIMAVNHRGYNVDAPENTLAAFRLSKKMGFTHVECDVGITSDGVAVLLHDDTVDRTSDGTGSIASLTLEEVRAMDFGSWFSADYAGEQIPTFDEFVALCKRLGLHPYIELKSTVTTAVASSLVESCKRYDILREVTWISFNTGPLEAVLTSDTKARVGLVANAPADSLVTWVNNIKTDDNSVFVDLNYTTLTESFVEQCAANSIPLEVWTVNSSTDLAAIDPYVSGYTSDSLRANVVLYDAAMADA